MFMYTSVVSVEIVLLILYVLTVYYVTHNRPVFAVLNMRG